MSLPTQIALLRGLRAYLDLPIPDPIYASAGPQISDEAFFGYPMIPGEPLSQLTLQTADDQAVVILAGQLATFLRSLHGVPPSAVSADLTNLDGRERWTDLYTRVRERLGPHLRPDARIEVARHFEAFLDDSRSFEYGPVIRHGDFGAGNILVDPATSRLSGVIDFDSAGLGDPAVDLATVVAPGGYGNAFVQAFRSAYPVTDAILARCEFYRGTWALQEALHGIDVGDAGAFERGIARYR